MNRKKSKGKKRQIIISHVLNNKKEYVIITLMFIIGIFIGVMVVNNSNEQQRNEISTYFNNSIGEIKQIGECNYLETLKDSVISNLTLVIVLWFLGTTIIGIPIVFCVIAYKGFCLGYTISISIIALGMQKGISFILAALLPHNIISIPVTIALAVSGFKLYKSIIKDKRKENIKTEILRHTIFSLIMLVILILSSIIEVYISTNLVTLIAKYL